jgi:hypothetical protein
MTTLALLAGLDWLPVDDLWWTLAAGLSVSMLAFLVCARVFTGSGRARPSEPLADDQLQEHDPFAVGGRTERRGAFRRKGSAVTVKFTDEHQLQQPREGWVIDRSMGGLGLWSEKPVDVGTILKVRPDHAPELTPWIEVEVKSCNPHEGGWRVHCGFIKTPPYSVLLLFG